MSLTPFAPLKLVRYPRSFAPTLVALPSMSLIPFAPFGRCNGKRNEQTSVTRVADRGEIPLLLDEARRSGTHGRLSNAEAGRSGELEVFWREFADHGVADRQPKRFDYSVSNIGGHRNWYKRYRSYRDAIRDSRIATSANKLVRGVRKP